MEKNWSTFAELCRKSENRWNAYKKVKLAKKNLRLAESPEECVKKKTKDVCQLLEGLSQRPENVWTSSKKKQAIQFNFIFSAKSGQKSILCLY